VARTGRGTTLAGIGMNKSTDRFEESMVGPATSKRHPWLAIPRQTSGGGPPGTRASNARPAGGRRGVARGERAAAGGTTGPTSLLDDAMRRYAAGDDDAFDTLYSLLAPPLRALCRRLTSCDADAQDLFQETLYKIHRGRASYAPEAHGLPWAFAIARAEFVDRMRANRRRPEQFAVGDAESLLALQQSSRGLPESHLAHTRQLSVVARELEAMPASSRAACLLRYEGWTVAEAAAALSETSDVIKQRVYRASARVRAALRRYGWGSSAQAAPKAPPTSEA
jgi:RNA polymerase sigma-70 factor (ECF subfamily)